MESPVSAQVTLLVERGASTYQQTALGFEQAFPGKADLEHVEIDENGRLDRDATERWSRNPPRLIVAIGTRAARAAADRFPTLPILYCLTLRPLANQLVGTNIGGIVLDAELPQQFESIHKLLPDLRRIGMVYDDLVSGPAVRRTRQYLASGISMTARNARTPQEAEREIRDLFNNVLGPRDAFWMLWDSVVANPANFRTLVELSLKNKVPLIVPARPFVEAGALVSVNANYREAGRQLAVIAQRVIDGRARPGDFPVVEPIDLTVTINGEVARKLGIPIPPDLRADLLSPVAEGKSP